MCAKRKVADAERRVDQPTPANEPQIDRSKQTVGQDNPGAVEDYIWTAMQHYAAELRAGNKPGGRMV